MIAYYENVIEVIKNSIESIPDEQYEQLLDECVKTLKENEAVWTSRETLMYKRDSRFDYYKDGKKLKSSFIHFNPFKDKIVAVLKEESSIIFLKPSFI